MAVMDDEICRNELEGSAVGDGVITFPPNAETIQGRYRLFLQMNQKKSRRQLQEEIKRMEQRLRESREHVRQPNERLDAGKIQTCD